MLVSLPATIQTSLQLTPPSEWLLFFFFLPLAFHYVFRAQEARLICWRQQSCPHPVSYHHLVLCFCHSLHTPSKRWLKKKEIPNESSSYTPICKWMLIFILHAHLKWFSLILIKGVKYLIMIKDKIILWDQFMNWPANCSKHIVHRLRQHYYWKFEIGNCGKAKAIGSSPEPASY